MSYYKIHRFIIVTHSTSYSLNDVAILHVLKCTYRIAGKFIKKKFG